MKWHRFHVSRSFMVFLFSLAGLSLCLQQDAQAQYLDDATSVFEHEIKEVLLNSEARSFSKVVCIINPIKGKSFLHRSPFFEIIEFRFLSDSILMQTFPTSHDTLYHVIKGSEILPWNPNTGQIITAYWTVAEYDSAGYIIRKICAADTSAIYSMRIRLDLQNRILERYENKGTFDHIALYSYPTNNIIRKKTYHVIQGDTQLISTERQHDTIINKRMKRIQENQISIHYTCQDPTTTVISSLITTTTHVWYNFEKQIVFVKKIDKDDAENKKKYRNISTMRIRYQSSSKKKGPAK